MPTEAIDLLTRGGAVAILSWLVLALINGWIVPKSTVEARAAVTDARIARAEKDADFWRDIALKGTDIAEQMVKARLADLEARKP